MPHACNCSLCTEYDAAYGSDPDLTLQFSINDALGVSKRQTGTNTSDFYIGKYCAQWVLVTCAIDGKLYAVINSCSVADVDFMPPQSVTFTESNVAQRLLRRKAKETLKDVASAVRTRQKRAKNRTTAWMQELEQRRSGCRVYTQ